jgi:hypothetical protein
VGQAQSITQYSAAFETNFPAGVASPGIYDVEFTGEITADTPSTGGVVGIVMFDGTATKIVTIANATLGGLGWWNGFTIKDIGVTVTALTTMQLSVELGIPGLHQVKMRNGCIYLRHRSP